MTKINNVLYIVRGTYPSICLSTQLYLVNIPIAFTHKIGVKWDHSTLNMLLCP